MTKTHRARWTTILRGCLWLGLACLWVGAASGCGGGGLGRGSALELRSLGNEPVRLPAARGAAVYGTSTSGDVSIFLTDIPLADLMRGDVEEGQLVHVELLWQPKAGATPMDPSATNVTVRHLIVSGGEMGLYGGAGFATFSGNIDRGPIAVNMKDSTLRLLDATEGFVDPISPGTMVGRVRAERSPEQARKLFRAASQMLTNALGRRQFASSEHEHPTDHSRPG